MNQNLQVEKQFCDGCKKAFEELEKVKIDVLEENKLDKKLTSHQKSMLALRLLRSVDGVMDGIFDFISDDEYADIMKSLRDGIWIILLDY